MTGSQCAVVVRDCSMSYPKPKGTSLKICEKFNLTLPQGEVYAILGPSSCGKTSLLRAILGRKQIDEGGIFVFGRKVKCGNLFSEISPSDIGYMPQDTCLYDMLTIGETLSFYGGVLGLSKKVIKERIDYFIEFLRLPDKNSINSKLSGGQLRRVSFAASVIHQPKLLILDEPTVGLDPIVRQKIWQYLTKMATIHLVSILLTTHFIEEARSANLVGMWHGHQLHVEAAPELLLASTNCLTLEDAFLRICFKVTINTDSFADRESVIDDAESLNLAALAPRCDEISVDSGERPGCCSHHCQFNINRTCALTWKNFIRFFRFPGALLFLIGLPAFTILTFCLAVGRMKGIELAVLMSDNGHLGKRFLDLFEPEAFTQTAVTSIQNGRDALLSGRQTAFIDIKQNFSEQFQSIYTSDDRILERSNDSFIGGKIVMILDGLNFAQSSFTVFRAVNNLEEICFQLANYSGMSSVRCRNPIHVARTLKGLDFSKEPLRLFYIQGMLVLASYFVAFPCAMLSFFLEKKNGYVERGYIAGVSTLETVCSFVAVTTAIILAQMVGILTVTIVIFKNSQSGSMLLIFALLLWVAFSGMSAGFMLSSCTDNVNTLYLISSFYFFYSIAFAGWLWPISAMPKPMLYFSYIMPFALPVEALCGIMHYDWGITNFKVLMAFAVTTAWMPIFNAITFYKLRAKNG